MKYHLPGSVHEYEELTGSMGEAGYAILAGGTDLIPGYEGGQPLPEHLINVKAIPNLNGIQQGKQHVEIGALTTIETLRRDAYIRSHFPALAQACEDFGSVQIRHRATLGGNIVNASPAADTLPALFVYNATVKLRGTQGERVVGVRDFILNPGDVDLQRGELLHSIQIPRPDCRSLFHKLGLRQAMAIAVVNYAILYEIKHQYFTSLTVAAGAVAPRVVYLKTFMEAVVGEGMALDQAIALVDDDIAPIDDIRATAGYRRMVLKNLLLHTLRELLTDDHER
ncbi:FAD binding domain-containing protein [Candidatus Neomarinimicrobiota bacterium]